MDFEYTPTQRAVYDRVGELGMKAFAPRAGAYDEKAETPLANLRDLFDAGFAGLTISEDLGGLGSGAMGDDPLLYLIAIEQTARYCGSTAHCLHIHCHGAHLVDSICSDDQRRNILVPVIERGAMLNATGSEPGRTSRGLYNLVTVAERARDGYVVNGVKNYASLADVVDFNIIFAGIKGKSPTEGHIGLCVPKATPGLTIPADSWNPMGMRAAVSPNIILDNCFVSDDYVIGEPGTYVRDRWQARFHLGFAAQYLGGAEGIYDYLADYLPKRGTASDSYAQLRMGEIRIGTDSVRWLIYRAAWLWKKKQIAEAELFSLMAKHRAIENAVTAMDKGAQIAGSSAFHARSSFARFFRDLRVQTLHENLDKTAATIGKYHLGQEFDTTARL